MMGYLPYQLVQDFFHPQYLAKGSNLRQLGTSDFRSGVEMHGIRRRIDAGGTSRKAAEELKIAGLHKELNTTIYYYILWFSNFNFKLCFFPKKCW